jgi:hypothetical protein
MTDKAKESIQEFMLLESDMLPVLLNFIGDEG